MSETLRVVALKDGDKWVAHCLEYDVAAQGAHLEEAYDRLSRALNAERAEGKRRTGQDFGGIGPAPDHVHEIWERRSKSAAGGNSVTEGDGNLSMDVRIAA